MKGAATQAYEFGLISAPSLARVANAIFCSPFYTWAAVEKGNVKNFISVLFAEFQPTMQV